jgi:hypothetical protein
MIQCTTNICPNEDHTATLTVNLCDVSYKTLQTYFEDPSDWINTLIKDTIQIRSEEIYRKQLDKHISMGNLPANSTKRSIILSYEKDSGDNLEL